jgi:thiosulfate/3-mercaptopyruvate sulfurtransferase
MLGRSQAPDPSTADAQSIGSSNPGIPSSRWVVDAATARALIGRGAVVVDARSPDLKARHPFPNAISVVWQDFVGDVAATKGRLLCDDTILTQRLQALGISNEVPVLFVDDAKSGGGEDRRMAWTLRTRRRRRTG